MERERDSNVIKLPHEHWDWSGLLRKMRDLGMDQGARRLELALRTLPPEKSAATMSELGRPK